MSFRSPLLQAYPTRRGRVLTTHRRRALLVSIAGFILGIPTAMVALRLPPVDGWGYPLYWLHDHLYLPLEGQLFTRFLPYSIAAWIIIAAVALGLLFTYLTGQSLVHALHLNLLEFCLRQRGLRPALLASAKRMRHIGPGSVMMAEVCDNLRRRASASSRSPTKPPDEVLALCLFLCELTLDCALPHHYLLRAALAVQETLEHYTPQPSCPAELVQLLQRLPRLLKRLMQRDEDNPYADDPTELPFAVAAFAQDLLVVASIHMPALTAPSGKRRSPERAGTPLLRQLALANDRRRTALDALRLAIEDRQLRLRPTPLPPLPLTSAPLSDLPWWGRWHFSLVMSQARLERRPESALRQVDTLEALRLTLALLPDEAEEDLAPERLLALLGELPQPHHWRLLAEWTDVGLSRSRDQFASSSLQRDGVLRGDEFDLLQERSWALRHAAGPDQLPVLEQA